MNTIIPEAKLVENPSLLISDYRRFLDLLAIRFSRIFLFGTSTDKQVICDVV